MSDLHVGVMGAAGSFSEQAGERFVQEYLAGAGTVLPLVTAEAVLAGVEAGEVTYGIFPIENSNGGIVMEAVHAMAKHRFAVEYTFELDVHHMLLVKPGVTVTKVAAISSHDQALKQCRMYLKRVWPEVDIVPYADTAKAAEDLANGTLPDTTAVIAPRRCADMYGLQILEESIQDLKFNYTTFVVATKLQ